MTTGELLYLCTKLPTKEALLELQKSIIEDLFLFKFKYIFVRRMCIKYVSEIGDIISTYLDCLLQPGRLVTSSLSFKLDKLFEELSFIT